ncbi:hypothetical protein H0W91_01045 [Patescibacteria group bacterium]|nr:hypothetical protein [Patescibacteria group bacterium]
MNSFEVAGSTKENDDIPEGLSDPIDKQDIPEKRPEPEKKLTKEELEKYREKGQKMLDSYKRLFITFAKDVSLKFKLSDGFYIDLDSGEVNLDTKWFAGRGFSEDQILWATLHELSHFLDLADDPKGMMDNFSYVRQKAKKTGALLFKKFKDSGIVPPEMLEKISEIYPSEPGQEENLSPIENAAYGIHHKFYNALDDIYVNNVVSRKASRFEEKRKGGNEIKRLYQEKLFRSKDYSKLPLHMQFSYKILRAEMIRDEEVLVSPEIDDIFSKKIEFEGGRYTISEIIEKFLKPRTARNTKPEKRYQIIHKTLEPIFDDLLRKDIEAWNPKSQKDKNKEKEEGPASDLPSIDPETDPEADPETNSEESFDPNPFAEDYKEFDKNNPDKINEKDIKEWAEKQEEIKNNNAIKEAQDKTEKEKARKEQEKKAQEARDMEWAEKNSISAESMKEFRNIESEVAPYLEELSRLWRDIVLGSSKGVDRTREGYFKTGEINIGKTIEDWPKIEKRQLDDVKVMERIIDKERLIEKPELIRVRVVGDMSGSMFQDPMKIKILKQAFVLILSSLKEFNTYLSMNRQSTKSKLEVDTEAWLFGSYVKKIKSFRSDSGKQSEQADIINVFSQMDDNMQDTFDNFVFENINESLTQSAKEKIAKEKILEIVFEITDGASSSPGSTKKEIDKLSQVGVVVKGFQIGKVSREETQVFNSVWNTGQEKRGEVVGNDLRKLIPAISSALKKYLRNVRL